MAVTVRAMAPATLVEIVNEWGTVPREVAGELDRPYPSGRDLDDDALRRVADRLHPIFASATAAEAAELVNVVLIETAVVPFVVLTDGRPEALWAVDRPRHAPLASAALTLRDHLDRHGFTRLGTCAGSRCADVYIDTSPTRDRRYCSTTCQNRARAAAFRRRHARATTIG